MQIDQTATEIRFLGGEDSRDIAHLAELDTARPPHFPVLGAIVDSRLVAAHSLATGESIADPFRPTAEIRSLLALRARQLRRDRRGPGLLGRIRRRSGPDVGSGVPSPDLAR